MSHPALLGVGQRIPDVRLPSPGAPRRRPLRGRPRETVVVLVPHEAGCGGCLAHLDALLATGDVLAYWDARVVVVLPPGASSDAVEAWSARGGATVLLDEDGRLIRSLGGGAAAVIVADRWGDVYEVARDPEGHALPGPRELEEWLRYIGTQCPE